jgi:hypothetical protein
MPATATTVVAAGPVIAAAVCLGSMAMTPFRGTPDLPAAVVAVVYLAGAASLGASIGIRRSRLIGFLAGFLGAAVALPSLAALLHL